MGYDMRTVEDNLKGIRRHVRVRLIINAGDQTLITAP
jgi:hypothetical protein